MQVKKKKWALKNWRITIHDRCLRVSIDCAYLDTFPFFIAWHFRLCKLFFCKIKNCQWIVIKSCKLVNGRKEKWGKNLQHKKGKFSLWVFHLHLTIPSFINEYNCKIKLEWNILESGHFKTKRKKKTVFFARSAQIQLRRLCTKMISKVPSAEKFF